MIAASHDTCGEFRPESSCIESYFEPLSPTSPCNADIHSSSAGILFVSQGKSVQVESAVDAAATVSGNCPTAAEMSSKPKLLLRCVSAGNFYERNHLKGRQCGRKLTDVCETTNSAPPPSILVSSTDNATVNATVNATEIQQPHCDVRLSKYLSHSSDSFEIVCLDQLDGNDLINQCRASSESNLPNTDANTKSFTSLNYFQNAFKLPSPTHISGNSLASLAKGVQSLGANFDPRKMLESPKKLRDDEKMQSHCSATKIIHL